MVVNLCSSIESLSYGILSVFDEVVAIDERATSDAENRVKMRHFQRSQSVFRVGDKIGWHIQRIDRCIEYPF